MLDVLGNADNADFMILKRLKHEGTKGGNTRNTKGDVIKDELHLAGDRH